MSGHSKWNSIKHKKAANDAARGKVLTKHAKLLAVAARNDANPETNAILRSAISNAKSDGVPRENIEKILKKASGEGKDAAQFIEQIYEGFGPSGVAFMVTALTDNPLRTMPAVRTAFIKNGGNFGSTGSVSFLFDRVGVIFVENGNQSEDELFELAIEAGADDFIFDDEGVSEIITKFSDLAKVRDALADKVTIKKSEPQYRAKEPKDITDETVLEKLEKFVSAVEEVEDVDEVYSDVA